MTEKRFKGCQYPLENSVHGLFATKQGTATVKCNLLQLLLTNPGERVMLPTFGVALKELLFEPATVLLEERARQMIAKAISIWEPRVVIEDLFVTVNPTEDQVPARDEDGAAILYINIKFRDPENVKEVEELVITRPLGV